MSFSTATAIPEFSFSADHDFLQNDAARLQQWAVRVVDFLRSKYSEKYIFSVFCGTGQKGALGFALAQNLFLEGRKVEIYSSNNNISVQTISSETEISQKLLPFINFNALDSKKINRKSVIIDALFETDQQSLKKEEADLILKLNTIKAIKIALHLPSGLYSQETTPVQNVVFKTAFTLSLKGWQMAYLQEDSARFCGKIVILKNIEKRKNKNNALATSFLIDKKLIKEIYKPREDFSHKGTYGKSAIIAGSYGKMGAAILAVRAALTAGSGLTFSISPKCGFSIIQSCCPEAMFIPAGKNTIAKINIPEDAVVGIGPGIGTGKKTQKVFLEFLKDYKKPLVIDADALNIFAENPSEMQNIPPFSVLSPHPKEFQRLFGPTANSYERTVLAQKRAVEHQIIVILKGHHTQIFLPDGRVFYNTTGNSGMAKGGSGDVLTGILTSLLSQGYTPEEAALFGVWLHGKAGDKAAKKHSREAMLPQNLIAELGNVFLELKR